MFPIFFEQEHIPMMIFNRRDSARSGERMDVPSAMTTVGLVIPRACPDEGNISSLNREGRPKRNAYP
jgi:hypothetical protein